MFASLHPRFRSFVPRRATWHCVAAGLILLAALLPAGRPAGVQAALPAPGAGPVVPRDTFEDASFAGLPQLAFGSVAWADYDNDGRLDFLLTGSEAGHVSRLYHNTAAGFVDASSLVPGLPQVSQSSVAWGDYDNDNRADFLLTGISGTGNVSKLYHNTPAGFVDTSSLVPALPQVTTGSVTWADYDNDGRLDFLISGYAGSGGVSKLYDNTGSGFVDVSSLVPALPQVYLSRVAWGDYDSDGRPDFLITGYQPPDESVSKLYHNTGAGFADASSLAAGLPQVDDGSVAWGDYDNDGRLDFLIAGCVGAFCAGPVSELYHNTGTGFVNTSSLLPSLPLLAHNSAIWGDYDNDGRLDLLVAGYTGTGSASRLYRNTGTAFEDASSAVPGLPQVDRSSAAWADYDNDGRLDLLLTGLSSGGHVSKLYHNTGGAANTAPGPPTNLRVNVSPTTATLQWDPAADGQTPPAGLSYNLRVGTTPGGSDIVGPMADPATGFRRLAQRGPVQGTAWTLTWLLNATRYYWSVQAVDTGLAGGPFAAEGSFDTAGVTPSVTPVAATSTPAPPSATPAPTQTPGGPTATQVPPSATPAPTQTLAPPTPCPIEYTDVPADNPFYPYIRCLACRGIVSGYTTSPPCTTGTPCFQPAANVTRGQMAKFVANAAGYNDVILSTQQTFTDVPPSSPFWLFVERAYLHGIISGYTSSPPCTTGVPCFQPGVNVTRGQTSKFVSNAANYQDAIPSSQQTFTDVPPSSPFWLYTERAYAHGVISGYTSSPPCTTGVPCFQPGNNVTRGQTSKFISNAFFPGCVTPAR
ncbi:MAG TPA: FG-GAP-like repeat-containing protein [Chloroflexia bacterium]|nr:FG-GAP-like repeat-containing protein [Chloroflexia bacterium]